MPGTVMAAGIAHQGVIILPADVAIHITEADIIHQVMAAITVVVAGDLTEEDTTAIAELTTLMVGISD
jgi:hypothetical protein